MGIIKAAAGAVGGAMDDVWKEMFVCDSLPMETLMVRGYKRISNRSANTGGDGNVITHGSLILVADGQCALVVSGGKVVECFTEPGEHTFRDPDHISAAAGMLHEIGQRISFGGDAPPKTQRVYYVNTKESMNNPFQAERPIDLLAAGVDPLYGTVTCRGVYSYRIKDPVLFYKLLAGNISGKFNREKLNSQITAQLLKSMTPALHTLCISGLRPSEIPENSEKLSAEIRERSNALKGWLDQRGLEIVSVALSSLEPSGMGDVQRVQRLGPLLGGPASPAQPEPETPPEHPVQPEAPEKKPGSWTCVCGAVSDRNFCPECGRPRKWTCSCGQENTGRFCRECGKPRP